MMASAALQRSSLPDMYVSKESARLGETIWQLLQVGWEMGLSTSLTESEWGTCAARLAERFRCLADEWRVATRYVSSVHEMVLHPAYQQIIGMGQKALPFILQELERQPDHWFWALQAITGEDPVPREDRGNIAAMARHWLRWARERSGGDVY